MVMPVEITFHKMEESDALRDDIRKHAEKLRQFEGDIMKCAVVIEPAEHRHHKGNRFVLRIRVTLPGGELDVGHTPAGDRSHQDAYVAIRDAFKAMRRKLQDFHRVKQGKVKHHEPPEPRGRVRYVDAEGGYGVIEAEDGRDIHFHGNSLVDTELEKVAVGDEVRFVEVPGDQEPWASTVHMLGRHRG